MPGASEPPRAAAPNSPAAPDGAERAGAGPGAPDPPRARRPRWKRVLWIVASVALLLAGGALLALYLVIAHLSEGLPSVERLKSIGQAASSGCIRMLNEHVIDLYNRVPLGTRVVVTM